MENSTEGVNVVAVKIFEIPKDGPKIIFSFLHAQIHITPKHGRPSVYRDSNVFIKHMPADGKHVISSSIFILQYGRTIFALYRVSTVFPFASHYSISRVSL